MLCPNCSVITVLFLQHEQLGLLCCLLKLRGKTSFFQTHFYLLFVISRLDIMNPVGFVSGCIKLENYFIIAFNTVCGGSILFDTRVGGQVSGEEVREQSSQNPP